MLELLNIVLSFAWNLVDQVLGLLALVLAVCWDVLLYVHVEMPRIEGLLVGITLAWLVSRRDRHPLLRVLSSPMKLVIDILDLAWDQVVEVVSDLWQTATGWVSGIWGWCVSRVKSGWQWVIGRLSGLRDKLRKEE